MSFAGSKDLKKIFKGQQTSTKLMDKSKAQQYQSLAKFMLTHLFMKNNGAFHPFDLMLTF